MGERKRENVNKRERERKRERMCVTEWVRKRNWKKAKKSKQYERVDGKARKIWHDVRRKFEKKRMQNFLEWKHFRKCMKYDAAYRLDVFEQAAP